MARTAQGYALSDFAELLGVSKQAVTLWERGQRTPPPVTVFRLESLLDLAPHSLAELAYPGVRYTDAIDLDQAIMAAPDLTIAQREGLLGVLRAYRAAGAAEHP